MNMLEHVAITCGDCTISGCLQSTAWKTDIGYGCLLVLHNRAVCWLLSSQLLALTSSTLASALLTWPFLFLNCLTLIGIAEIVLRPHRQRLQYVEAGRLFGRRRKYRVQ